MDKSAAQPVRKRFRIPVSCRACRKRKTKCDRTKPRCQYCTKNKLECIYESPNTWEDQSVARSSPETGQSVSNSNNNAEYTHRLEKELLNLRNKIANIESTIEQNGQIMLPSDNEISDLGLPLNHPYVSPTDTIDFYARYHCLTGTAGIGGQSMTAFSWKTMIKKDPFIQILWLKLIASTERRLLVRSIRESKSNYCAAKKNPLVLNSVFHDAEMIKEEVEGNEMLQLPEDMVKHRKLESNITKVTQMLVNEIDYSAVEKDEKLKSLNNSIESSSNPKYAKWKMIVPRPTTHDQLVKLILDKLPNKKVVWLLIDRFFKYVYPFMPYVDENCFKKSVTKIIGERSMRETEITELNIESKLEIAHIGILLFVLEFGSFTLFHNSPNDQTDDASAEYLIKNQMTQDNATLAKYCFAQFKFFRHVSLEILQLAIFKRLYLRYSPLDGDGTDANESQIFNGLLLQMAVSLGLNRDSETYGSSKLNFQSNEYTDALIVPENVGNLKRKIWHFIVMNDSYHTYVLAGTSSARIDFYDTALPHKPTDLNRNSNNMDAENFIYESFHQFAKYDSIVKNFIYDLLSFKPSNVKIILLRVHKLEMEILSDFKDFHEILFNKYATGNSYLDNLRKVFSTNQYIELKSVIYLVYYHVFIHYEASQSNDDAAFYYLQKIVKIGAELSESLSHFLTKSKSFFGEGYDFYLTPTLELMFHKSIQMKYGLQFRLSQYEVLYKLKGSQDNIDDRIKSLINALYSSYLKSVKAIVTITDRYYYAWKMCKFQRICILLLMSKEQLFKVAPDGSLTIKGDDKNAIKPPQNSILERLNQSKVISFMAFVEDALDSRKNDKVFDPKQGSRADNLIFSYGYDIGHYSKKSSERTKPLRSTDDSSSSTTINSPSVESTTTSGHTFSPGNLAMDPDVDKWWIDFLNNKNSVQYTDLYGKVPDQLGGTNIVTNGYSGVPPVTPSGFNFINTAGSTYDIFSDSSGSLPNMDITLGTDQLSNFDAIALDEILRYISEDTFPPTVKGFDNL